LARKRDWGKVVEKRRREIDNGKRRKWEEKHGELIKISSELQRRNECEDAEVNRMNPPATLPIASHVDLPMSSHQGVVGGLAQGVHKHFISEACSCIRVDETKDVRTTLCKTQTHTDWSSQMFRDMCAGV
jgi:hypothetical protein